jgi:hypothetical protein
MQPKLMLIACLALVAGLLPASLRAQGTASLTAGLAPTRAPRGTTEAPYASCLDPGAGPVGHRVTVSQVRFDPPGAPSPSTRPVGRTRSGTGWQRIEFQDFESTTFPDPPWSTRDLGGMDGGEYLWGRRDCRAVSGSYSGWAGGGGGQGGCLACTDTYTNNLKTWLDYGPVDLSQATDAELQFSLWADVEGNGPLIVDKVAWNASVDGSNYWGYATAGQTADWVPVHLSLSRVPILGDLTGQPEVYLNWTFRSNASNPAPYEGAFVDDAALWVYVPPSPPPPLPTPTLPITRHTTLADFAGGRSHDSTVVKAEQGDGALALAAQANALGDWERLPSLPRELFFLATVTAKDHLFIVGGTSPDGGYQRRVYSAEIQDGGLLDHWVELAQLPQALTGHAAVVANDHLFVLGGLNANGLQAAVFSALIHDDGTLGKWTTLPALPEPLEMSSAVSAHGYIYLLGGRIANDPVAVSDTVYRAAVNADGTLGDWEPLPSSLPRPSQQHAAVVACDYIYLLGGNDAMFEWNGVYRAEIQPDGSLGAWSQATPIPKTLSQHAAVAVPGGILITGGWHTPDPAFASQKKVYWAPLGPDCSLGAWAEVASLPYGTSAHALAATDRYVYNLGGANTAPRHFASVLMAPLQLDDSHVGQGVFNHQFHLGDNYTIGALRWTEEGSGDAQVRLRYRVGDAGTGEYGPWSDYTSTNLVAIDASGGFLEYQLQFEGGSGLGDRYVTDVGLSFAPLHSVYMPLVVKD